MELTREQIEVRMVDDGHHPATARHIATSILEILNEPKCGGDCNEGHGPCSECAAIGHDGLGKLIS